MPTDDIVAEAIDLIDGSASANDPRLRKVWRSRMQISSSLIWNDRFWQFKVTEATVTFHPNPQDVPTPTPDGFGSFEALGAGVYLVNPERELRKVTIGEMAASRLGSVQRPGIPEEFCLYYIDGEPHIRVRPVPIAAVEAVVVFLRRAPKLQLDIDPDPDELHFIPEQWHDLVRWGGEWLNAQKTANSTASAEQAVWKAGLDEMRAREACIVRGLVPYRAGGRRR